MGKNCCGPVEDVEANNDPLWRRILWIALILNAVMFSVEIVAGLAADLRALQADALDFLGDAANYAISLCVAGMALAWRACAAIASSDHAGVRAMGAWLRDLGFLCRCLAGRRDHGHYRNRRACGESRIAAMLFRFRTGDANMRSVWICSRNDAIGNVAVLGAALGVFGTGRAWPDLVVAAIMASLAIWGSIEVFGQARGELRSA